MPPTAPAEPALRRPLVTRTDALLWVALALGYAAASWPFLGWARGGPVSAPVWPAAGLGLAVLVVGGRRLWPGVFVGATAALWSVAGPVAAPLVAGGYTASTWGAAWLLARWSRTEGLLDKPSHAFRYAAVAGLYGLAAATLAMLALLATAPGLLEKPMTAWVAIALSHAGAAVFLAAPMLVAARGWQPYEPPWALRSTKVHALLLGLGFVGYTAVVLTGAPQDPPWSTAWGIAVITALIWPIVVFGTRGAVLGASALLVVGLVGVLTGEVTGTQDPETALLTSGLSQVLVFVLMAPIGAMVDQRRRFQADLAGQVRERTRALAESEARFRSLAEAAPVGIFHADATGTIDFVNRRWLAIAGRPADEIALAIHPDDVQRVRAQGAEAAAAGAPVSSEFRFIHPDGAVRWVSTRSEPVLDAEGRPGGWVGTVEDVTEQRAHEAALRKAKEAAEDANKAKSAFLATMSHEIRTPLNAVLGTAQLMRGGPLLPEQEEDLGTIQTAGEHLLTVINDILDYSKGEAGRLTFEAVPVDLRRVAQQAVRLVGPATSSEVMLEVEAPPRPVMGDPNRIRQILVNYLANAVKFTRHGEIRVRLALETDAAGQHLHMQVSDTGIGIPPERLPDLFQPFTQVDSSLVRRFEGTGLGLAIVRRVVESLGGTAWAESELGKGSTFHARFPATFYDGPELAPAEARAADDARPLEVLLVEDNAVNRMVAVRMLERLGHHVDVAGDGKVAVEKVGRKSYDVVLMDVHMPVMDGLEATRAIRRTHGRARPRIVALTADALAHDRDKCMAAGMDDYVAKPVRLEDLATKVAAR